MELGNTPWIPSRAGLHTPIFSQELGNKLLSLARSWAIISKIKQELIYKL
jgi:hypothetical protein